MPRNLMTFDAMRKAATAALRGAKIDTADVDARILLAHAAKCSDVDLIVQAYDSMPPRIAVQFQHYITRRALHEPIAYITGQKGFWSLNFDVNTDVLIPRPETEGLVEQALKLIANIADPSIIDVGTGSGAILISMLHERQDANGVGVDISNSALNTARSNAKKNNVAERCSFLQSDFLESVTGQYDVLVSNPPYITDRAMGKLPDTVQCYEPKLALYGGDDGLDPYRKILSRAACVLKPEGYVVFEIGYDQGEAIQVMLKTAGYSDIKIFIDLNGLARVVSAKMQN